MHDVIGIGALNVDYFVNRRGLSNTLSGNLDQVLENHSERFVDMGANNYTQNP